MKHRYGNELQNAYSNVLTDGQIAFNGTAAMAKWRLQMVIADDRARVPVGRWYRVIAFNAVGQAFRLGLIKAYWSAVIAGDKIGEATCKRLLRTRYRLVWR